MSFLLFVVAGCSDEEDTVVVADNAPPFPPDGVFSTTGDEQVTITWNQNWEEDLAGYAVYRSRQSDGTYTWIADVPWDNYCARYPDLICYTDTDVHNGETWYYAVIAFDESGNESELSFEDVFDTPRPEGFNLVLMDYLGQNAGSSGYDLSSLSNTAQAWNISTTDIYFGRSNGINYIFTAPAGVDIQDYGFIDLVDVSWAPETGWAPSGRVEAIPGHSYVVRVRGSGDVWFYAKIYVASITVAPEPSVTLDWAYQEVEDLPELAPGRGAMQ